MAKKYDTRIKSDKADASQKAMIEKWNGQLPNTMLNDGINGLFNIGQ